MSGVLNRTAGGSFVQRGPDGQFAGKAESGPGVQEIHGAQGVIHPPLEAEDQPPVDVQGGPVPAPAPDAVALVEQRVQHDRAAAPPPA